MDEGLNVKISDNALSRDFFPGDYHCFGDNENRPVRWMAAECLECQEYSPASDVVSDSIYLPVVLPSGCLRTKIPSKCFALQQNG